MIGNYDFFLEENHETWAPQITALLHKRLSNASVESFYDLLPLLEYTFAVSLLMYPHFHPQNLFYMKLYMHSLWNASITGLIEAEDVRWACRWTAFMTMQLYGSSLGAPFLKDVQTIWQALKKEEQDQR